MYGGYYQLLNEHNALVASHNELSAYVNQLSDQDSQLLDACKTMDQNARGTNQAVADLQSVTADLLELLSPPVEAGSSLYDCDDATFDAFRFYTERGYRTCIVAGNLDVTGESRYRVDHVWLLVRFEGGWLPVDWGTPALDCQHFEGYRMTPRQLDQAVEADYAS